MSNFSIMQVHLHIPCVFLCMLYLLYSSGHQPCPAGPTNRPGFMYYLGEMQSRILQSLRSKWYQLWCISVILQTWPVSGPCRTGLMTTALKHSTGNQQIYGAMQVSCRSVSVSVCLYIPYGQVDTIYQEERTSYHSAVVINWKPTAAEAAGPHIFLFTEHCKWVMRQGGSLIRWRKSSPQLGPNGAK